MITTIWNFVTTQFAFSQAGVSQSWLFWTVVLGCLLLKVTLLKAKK